MSGMERVKAHQIELAYELIGDGEPTVIVIPQWFLSSRSMRASALVRRLAERHRVLLYDRRGTETWARWWMRSGSTMSS
jgi:pimeloyl-ACP methyl ester carboxylesterase